MPTSTASSRNRKLYLFALGPLLAGVVLSLFGPSGEIAPVRFFEAMLRPDSGSPESLIFWSLRIPRTLAVLLCGAALSAAGLLLQRTLHNDLASPGILGINVLKDVVLPEKAEVKQKLYWGGKHYDSF